MQGRLIDIVVIAVYFGAIALAGLYFARKNTTTEAYFLGNRNFPAWAIGLSLVGTSISSVSFLAYPGDAYKTAWLRLVPAFTLPVVILIATIWILPFFRQAQTTTAFEYLEKRFGPSTRVYGAVAFIIAQLVRLSLILYLVSLLLHEFTGWDTWICIVAGGVFVAFYTVLGGIEAVIWTDVAQTIVLIFGGLLCLFIIAREIPGGLSQIVSEASEAGKFKFAEYIEETDSFKPASWDFTFFRKTALMMLLVGFVNWMYEYTANQNVVQRYCASRSTADARKAMWICCFSSIPIWTYFMFLGSAFWVYYRHFPAPEATAMLTGETPPEQILPFFVLNSLPLGLAGIVVAAVLAAAMSSLDSSINAISAVGIVDLLRRHFVTDRDDAYYLKAARYIAVGSSVIMIGGALILTYSPGKTAQDTITILIALTAGGLLGLYMMGFLTRLADARAMGVAIVCTILFTSYRSLEGLGFLPPLPIDAYYTGIVGHVLMFVIGFGAGLLLPRKERDLSNLTVWTMDKSAGE